MKPEPKTETAAVITLHRVGEMHKRGRKAVAEYLRRVAKSVEEDWQDFGKKVVCRYIFTPKAKGK